MELFTKTYIESFDKKKLVAYISNNENYDTVIIVVHGMAEHIERYFEFCEKLIKRGYKVYAYSHRGHFPTDTIENYGYMGDGDNFQNLVEDLNCIVEYVKKNEENKKICIFSHSMGSFVSNRFSELYGNKINGLILCGSGSNSNFLLTTGNILASTLIFFKGRKYRSKLLDKITFGAYNKKFKPNRTEVDWLNRDEKEVDKYIDDPECGGIFTLAYFKYFFKGTKKLNKNHKKTPQNLKVLIFAGDKDPVGNMGKGTTKLYNKMKNENVTFKLFKDCRHEIMLEKNKDEVHNYVLDWLDNNL